MSEVNAYNVDIAATSNPFIANMVNVANQYAEQQKQILAAQQQAMASLPNRLANYSQIPNQNTSFYGSYFNVNTGNAVKISDKDAKLNANFYNGTSASGVNRRVDTKCNKSAAELNKYLKGVLAGKGEVFLEAERRYGVNALFLVAIAREESANGTSRLARQQNNVGGIGGQGNFKTYASIDDGIFAIAKNISQGKYFFKEGRKTIAAISERYCNSTWATHVNNLMNQMA